MSTYEGEPTRLRTALIAVAAVLVVAAVVAFILYTIADPQQNGRRFELRPDEQPASVRVHEPPEPSAHAERIQLEHIARFACPIPNDDFKGNPRWVRDCCFLSGGERICIANWGSVSVLETRTGRLIRILDARMLPDTAVSLDPEGTLIATTETDQNLLNQSLVKTRVRLWDAATGGVISTLAESDYVFESVAFDSATSCLIVAGGREPFSDYGGPAFSPPPPNRGDDAKSRDGVSRIEVWDIERRARAGEPKIGNGFIECIDAANGTLVAASGREVVLWNLVDGQRIDSWKHTRGSQPAVAIGRRVQVVASVCGNEDRAELVLRTHAQSRPALSRLILQGMSAAVAIAPSENYIAVGDGRVLRLLDLDRSTITKTEQSGVVSTLAFSDDGELLAAGGSDGEINVWRVVEAGVGRARRR